MKPQSITVRDGHGMDNTITVGEYDVVEIVEHQAQGEGDKWYYDVKFKDGKIRRIFSFIEVSYN